MYLLAKIQALLGSRRFWAAIIAAVLAVAGDELGLDPESVQWVVVVVVGWIIGDSLQMTSSPLVEQLRGVKK